jgi:glycerol-3-phosphate O-acyltransferase
MVPHPGFLVRMLGYFFFRWVRFEDVRLDFLKKKAEEGKLVYVMNRRSLLDYMYFQWAFLKHGLPLAEFSNGFVLGDALWIRRMRQIPGLLFAWLFNKLPHAGDDRGALREALSPGAAALLFLKPARGLMRWRSGRSTECLAELIALQRSQETPLLLVPQFLFWDRKPDRYNRSILDLVFGHPDAPGRLRKMINFVVNHRRSLVHVGEPVNLREFLAEHDGNLEGEDLNRQLRWRLNHQFLLESKVVKGPVIKDSKRMRSELLRNENFRDDLERIAVEQGWSSEKVHKQAARYLKELAADFQMWMIEAFSMVLAILWNRLYEGVEMDEEGLDRLRTAAKEAPLIVVPTHKSHIDYLVITYFFYHHGLITPHIAAGANLNFFPLGWLFRAAGAFFIRRSFKDNPVYNLVFRYYIRKLVKEGYWIEFFPEGGRSRTGKLLAPRLGLVRELIECLEDGVGEDLYFCPVSIGYEKVIEENVYSQELSGTEKKSESVGEILKATRVLASKYGRIYMRFAEPISAREFIRRWGTDDDQGVRRLDAKNIKRFGYTLVHGMNDASIVSPSSLVATVLLAHPRDAISRSQLVMRVGYLLNYVVGKGGHLSETLQSVWDHRAEQLESPPEGAELERGASESLTWGVELYRARLLARELDEVLTGTLNLFADSIDSRDYGDESVYSLKKGARSKLNFYKNNTIHLLAHDAILAAAMRAAGEDVISYDRLHSVCLLMSQLLKREFVYRPQDSFEGQFIDTLGRFVESGWVEENPDGTFRIPDRAVEIQTFFSNCVQNFLEGYSVALSHLEELVAAPRTEKEWTRSLQKRANALADEGALQWRECVSSDVFKNALSVLVELGFVTRIEEESTRRRRAPVRMLRVDAAQIERAAEFQRQLKRARDDS